jgi:molybdopterin converting factor small subunit
MNPLAIGVLLWMVATPVFLVLWLLNRRKFNKLTLDSRQAAALNQAALARAADEHQATKVKYASIISQEAEVARLQAIASTLTADIEKLRSSYAEKRGLFDRLEQQIAIYDERLAFAELGVYEPHFDFTDSEAFKASIVAVRDRQKAMISAKRATICSKAKGQTMINRQTRLTMRAFNNECEAAIANVRWNNVVAMEKRIHAAASSIDKENTSLNLTLNNGYVSLKIEELRLTHEYREGRVSELVENRWRRNLRVN